MDEEIDQLEDGIIGNSIALESFKEASKFRAIESSLCRQRSPVPMAFIMALVMGVASRPLVSRFIGWR